MQIIDGEGMRTVGLARSSASRRIRTVRYGRKMTVFVRCSSVFLLMLLSACSHTPPLPEPPPRYVSSRETPAAATPAANSLWRDAATLYEDPRARRLNDLVTIKVLESDTASGKADTTTGRDSTLDASVTNFFGLPLSASVNGGRYNLTPTASGSMKDDFKGMGQTTRDSKIVGMITAKVIEVLPNGTLALESRKEITLNSEKQILILQGLVRPDDIATDNTILSSRVADAKVFFVGDGVLQDKQRPGWLVRVLDKVWPF